MKRALMAVLAAVALTGGLAACETATPYQQLNPNNRAAGGYRDSRLDGTHWRVSFSGNSVTSRETVERYLLYRAAELATSQGFVPPKTSSDNPMAMRTRHGNSTRR